MSHALTDMLDLAKAAAKTAGTALREKQKEWARMKVTKATGRKQ